MATLLTFEASFDTFLQELKPKKVSSQFWYIFQTDIFCNIFLILIPNHNLNQRHTKTWNIADFGQTFEKILYNWYKFLLHNNYVFQLKIHTLNMKSWHQPSCWALCRKLDFVLITDPVLPTLYMNLKYFKLYNVSRVNFKIGENWNDQNRNFETVLKFWFLFPSNEWNWAPWNRLIFDIFIELWKINHKCKLVNHWEILKMTQVGNSS